MTDTPLLTPQERLAQSRSEIVHFMQKDNQITALFMPIVSDYAKKNPIKMLAVSAGFGVAMVVIKPWRLITLGSLLALLKVRK